MVLQTLDCNSRPRKAQKQWLRPLKVESVPGSQKLEPKVGDRGGSYSLNNLSERRAFLRMLGNIWALNGSRISSENQGRPGRQRGNTSRHLLQKNLSGNDLN